MTKQNRDQRAWQMRTLLLHGAMIAAPAALLVAHTRFKFNVPGLCVFKSIFGVECPACGVTHSVIALLSGDLRKSFILHPAGPIIAGIIGILTMYFSFVVIAGNKGFEWGKEVEAYTLIERLVIGALFGGWIGKLILG